MVKTRAHHYATTTPLFEEAYSNGLNSLLVEVELAIYKSLSQLGVVPSQVEFRKVVPRSLKATHWDYAELEVQLSRGQDLAKALKLLGANLTDVSGKVTWKTSKRTATGLEIVIKANGISTHRVALQKKKEEPVVKPSPPTLPKIAIVIDDLGYDGRLARGFLEIDGPLSFSVLPYGTFSRSISRKVKASGRDLLLHLPMEPREYPEVNPGDGALLVGMSDTTLIQKLTEDLNAIPDVVGVNNHMGSRFSEHEHKMTLVLQELKKRHLFFLDSKTSGKTKGYRLALQMGIPTSERDVFLDNIQEPQAIRRQIKRLVQLAHLRGSAIGIAHPHEITLEVFQQDIPRLSQQGVKLVPISQALHQ
jgi:polysaccharide deacetylase 2 family uncharacterized protein YibQ